MHWEAFSNNYGNAAKIVTDKNGAKRPQRFDNVCGNTYGSLW